MSLQSDLTFPVEGANSLKVDFHRYFLTDEKTNPQSPKRIFGNPKEVVTTFFPLRLSCK